MIPPTNISFSQSVIDSHIKSKRANSFPGMPAKCRHPHKYGMYCGLTEQTGQQGHKDEADQGDTAAGHELFHALGLGTGVVVAVTFEQVDGPPDTQTGTESDNESLENVNSRVKEIHERVAGIVLRKELELFFL